MAKKHDSLKPLPVGVDSFAKLVALHLKCDEEERVVGKCPTCGGKVSGYRFTEGEFEGHGQISCENCGLLLMR